MGIVDLRGREDEPEVRSLVGATTPAGTAAIGWESAGRLDACAVVERVGGDVRVLTLAGGDAKTAALLDALAAMLNARRIVAADGGVLRELDSTPAPKAAVSAATLGEVEDAIRASWGRDTSASPEAWSEHNPALGQCDVTALLLRELLGGEILIAIVIRDAERLEQHVWNRLPSGLTLDLTREQYRDGEELGDPRVEEPLGLARGTERFELFAARVRAALL